MSTRLIGIDAGTTNTRVWAISGDAILARADAPVGVRDTARDGNSRKLVTTLRQLIDRVTHEAAMQADQSPDAIVAAGMITSSLGLAEVPHRPAPVGMDELVADLPWRSFPEITEVPFLLVPGVRCGPKPCDLNTAGTADLMRGEETLSLGLVSKGVLPAPGALLNLGSHWKWIDWDAQRRITGSWTTLSGELIHATQTQTILTSAVSSERPEVWDATWLEAGVKEQARSGLARALFTVRLLELSGQGTPEQRLAYLTGCYLGADLEHFLRRSQSAARSSIGIVGHPALAEAWRHGLHMAGVSAVVISPAQVEAGLLHGLRLAARAKRMSGK